MSKKQSIILSVLLILASIVINLLNNDGTKYEEYVSFFSGMLFGAGIASLLKTLYSKKL